MVLAADGCFTSEFIALWIRTCGQRVQTETRAVKSYRDPPTTTLGKELSCSTMCEEKAPLQEKGRKADAGAHPLFSAVGWGTEHEVWGIWRNSHQTGEGSAMISMPSRV